MGKVHLKNVQVEIFNSVLLLLIRRYEGRLWKNNPTIYSARRFPMSFIFFFFKIQKKNSKSTNKLTSTALVRVFFLIFYFFIFAYVSSRISVSIVIRARNVSLSAPASKSSRELKPEQILLTPPSQLRKR